MPQAPVFYRGASQSLANGKPNPYAQKLYGKSGYLDLINNIYSIPTLQKRNVSDAILSNITSYYKNLDSEKLFYECLKLDKFPYDDPQLGVVKEYHKYQPSTLEANKKTIQRIGQQLLNFSLEELLFLCEQPVVPNRVMGQKFKIWLNSLGYPVLEEKDFLAFDRPKEIVFLKGSDKVLSDFAKKYLGYKDAKGLDLVAKKCFSKGAPCHVIGEAKWIGSSGGNQNNQIKDAIRLLNAVGLTPPIYQVAIIDGIIWLPTARQLYNLQLSQNGYIFSALFLQDFLSSV